MRHCAIRHHGKPGATGIASIPALIQCGVGLALFDLDGTGNKHLVVDATAFAACFASNPYLIRLHMFPCNSTNPILIRPYHAGAELVQKLKRCFITRKSKLLLELYSRHTCGLAGHQISSPESDMKRCVRTFHHCSNGKSCVATALATSQYAGARGYSPGISNLCTIRADKPARPAQPLKVICTSIGIREHPLKLGQRLRKRKVVMLKNVHLH